MEGAGLGVDEPAGGGIVHVGLVRELRVAALGVPRQLLGHLERSFGAGIAAHAAEEGDLLAIHGVRLAGRVVHKQLACRVVAPAGVGVVVALRARVHEPARLVQAEVRALLVQLAVLPHPVEALGSLFNLGRLERHVRTGHLLIARHDRHTRFGGIAGNGPLGIGGLVIVIQLGALVHAAHQAAVGPAAAHRVAVLDVYRRQNVHVRLEAAEGVREIGRAVALGEPPAARREHHARVELGAHVGAHLDAAAARLDPAPVALGDAELLGQRGVDGEVRIGVQVANAGHLEVLGVMEGHEAAARGEHDGVLLGHLGVVHLVLGAAMPGYPSSRRMEESHSTLPEGVQKPPLAMNLFWCSGG